MIWIVIVLFILVGVTMSAIHELAEKQKISIEIAIMAAYSVGIIIAMLMDLMLG